MADNTSHLAIRDWPDHLRPREKLLNKGPQALSDAELLAIFLRTGTSGRSAVDLAEHLLQQFNGLSPLLNASQQRFCQGLGLGAAKYAALQAILELSRRHIESNLRRGKVIDQPQLARDYILSRLDGLNHERFGCLFLDQRHRLIDWHELFRGSIASANIYPREVLRSALDYNAAAVIFAHNHPSGVAEPSQADRDITKVLVQALGHIDVRVLDHLVVADGRCVSFAERGWL